MKRVLLDENLPRKLKWRLVDYGFEVTTVVERGWAGMKNGVLLRRAEPAFDAFVTMDRGLSFQHPIETLDLCVVLVSAKDNRYETLLPMVSEIVRCLKSAAPGRVLRTMG